MRLGSREDISAWQAVMRSDAYLIRSPYTLASAEAAVAEAKRAIEIDPGYAAAYAVSDQRAGPAVEPARRR